MFLDLHRGILEVFVEAQARQLLRNEDFVEVWRVWRDRRAARLREEKRSGAARRRALLRRDALRREHAQQLRRGWRANAAEALQEVRAQRVPWTPPRPRVEVRPCARCGEPAEFREGVKAPVGHRCVKK